MGWIEGRKNTLEWSIRFTTKAMMCQVGMIFVNIFGIAWNVYWYKYGNGTQNVFFGFGVGAFSSNTLWTLSFIAKYFSEIREEKHELKYIREIELKEQLGDDRKIYQEAKTQYEQMFRQYQEMLAAGLQKSSGSQSYTAGQCDLNLQPASTQNCT